MMQTIESAVTGMETVLRESYPAMLAIIEAERNDGIKLAPFATIDWEESTPITSFPSAWILGPDESDALGKDRVWDGTILMYFFFQDRAKKLLTKRLYRYGEAIQRVFEPARDRTLRGSVISAKVTQVRYGATFSQRDNMFARDLEVTVKIRLMKGDR